MKKRNFSADKNGVDKCTDVLTIWLVYEIIQALNESFQISTSPQNDIIVFPKKILEDIPEGVNIDHVELFKLLFEILKKGDSETGIKYIIENENLEFKPFIVRKP